MANLNQFKFPNDNNVYDIEFKTGSYENVTNKPTVNGVTLSGNKSTADIIPIGMGLTFDEQGNLCISYSQTENPSGGTTVNIGGV